MRRFPTGVLIGLVLMVGCYGPVTLKTPPSDHPANPDATEAPVRAPSKTLREGPGEATKEAEAAGPDHSMHAEEQAKLPYFCPMHPDVRAASAGNCPKCGMAMKKELAK